MTTKKHYLLHTAGNCTYELAAIITAFTEHMKGKAKPNPSKGVVVGVGVQSQSYPWSTWQLSVFKRKRVFSESIAFGK